MVANAHNEPDPEGMKIFDRGYLVGVGIFIILLNILPLLQFWVHGIPEIEDCRGQGDPDQKSFPTLMVTAAVFGFLFFIVIVLSSIRTRRNLEKIQDQHLKNLPAKNALTFLGMGLLRKPLSFKNLLVSRSHKLWILQSRKRMQGHLTFDNYDMVESKEGGLRMDGEEKKGLRERAERERERDILI